MKNLISILLWVPAIGIRIVLIVIGLIAVPLSLLGDGKYRTPKMWQLWADVESIPLWWYDKAGSGNSVWARFWWMAIRNPTQGLAKLFSQPIPEKMPNPDYQTRDLRLPKASRWMRHGLYSEYWCMRTVGDKYFEFRIGWKFSDGTPGFAPTIQIRLGD